MVGKHPRYFWYPCYFGIPSEYGINMMLLKAGLWLHEWLLYILYAHTSFTECIICMYVCMLTLSPWNLAVYVVPVTGSTTVLVRVVRWWTVGLKLPPQTWDEKGRCLYVSMCVCVCVCARVIWSVTVCIWPSACNNVYVIRPHKMTTYVLTYFITCQNNWGES